MTVKILAVDDESDVLLIVQTALQAEGYDVVTATNGPEALERVRDEKPDVIVLDVMMPGMDGFEVLDHLKANDETAGIPVLMLTGLSDRERIKQAIVSGIHFYIIKPFDVSELLQKIAVALNSA